MINISLKKKKSDSQKRTPNNKNKIILIGCILISILIILMIFVSFPVESQSPVESKTKSISDYIDEINVSHTVWVPLNSPYFDAYITEKDIYRHMQSQTPEQGVRIAFNESIDLKIFDKLKPNDGIIVIYPIFTSVAYFDPGFYNYFGGKCDESCITDISLDNYNFAGYTSTGLTAQILYLLGYNFLTDIEVDKNPEILKNYDTVILLHNEYVTQKMFDAITSHPNLIFLTPNALYAEIDVNYDDNTMTLIRGHDYPPPENPANGFGYAIEEEFHDYEYDAKCDNWEFIEIENGFHLNCYTDAIIFEKLDILLKLKDLT